MTFNFQKLKAETMFIMDDEIDGNYYISLEKNCNWINVSDTDGILSLNGEIIYDYFPIIDNDFTLVPIRIVSEKFGASVEYNSEKHEVLIKKGTHEITLTIDSKTATVDNNPVELGTSAKIIQSRTYVPVRFVAENMSLKVDYLPDVLTFDKETIAKYNLNKNFLPVISVNESENNLQWTNEKIVTSEINYKVKQFDDIKMDNASNFVFCNFPEGIFDNIFLETYINQQETKGYSRFFASHFNYSKQSADYVVRFENKGSVPLELYMIKDNKIQTTEEYNDALVKTNNQDFYNKLLKGETEKYILNPSEKLDIVMENLHDHKFITCLIDFYSEEPVMVTAFMMKNTDSKIGASLRYQNIETPSIPYDYTYIPKSYSVENDSSLDIYKYYTVYSGYSRGFNILCDGSLKASEFNGKTDGIGFETGGLEKNINERNGLGEIYDIELIDPRGENNEITKATWLGNIPFVGDSGNYKRDRTRNYGNLGNWGIDYKISTELINDSDKDKIFTCYLIAPYQSTLNIITPENKIMTENINNKAMQNEFIRTLNDEDDNFTISKDLKKWSICKVLVPAGETKYIYYTYVLGTDSVSNVFHVWDCKSQ